MAHRSGLKITSRLFLEHDDHQVTYGLRLRQLNPGIAAKCRL